MSDMDTSDGTRRRNKRWPEALKREIVAATLKPAPSVSVVARQYDVTANQVFMCRGRYGDAPEQSVSPSPPATPALVPVTITPAPRSRWCRSWCRRRSGAIRSPAICSCFVGGTATSSRFSGTMVSACRSMPSGRGAKVVVVRRLRLWRPSRRRHVQPERHGQNERHRPAGLARRCPRPHRRASSIATPRTATLELEPRQNLHQPGGLKTAAPAALAGCLRGSHACVRAFNQARFNMRDR